LVQLQKDLEKIKKAGLQLTAISFDSLDVLTKYAEENGITYPLLSDEGSKTIDAYGIRNKEMDGGRIAGIPYPGTYIVDKKGIVRAKLFVERYQERHTTEDLLKAAEGVK
jgi:peroxiredoxin